MNCCPMTLIALAGFMFDEIGARVIQKPAAAMIGRFIAQMVKKLQHSAMNTQQTNTQCGCVAECGPRNSRLQKKKVVAKLKTFATLILGSTTRKEDNPVFPETFFKRSTFLRRTTWE